jgi:hypothetical protein
MYPFKHLPLEAITAKNPQAVSLKLTTNLMINVSASRPSNENSNLKYFVRTGQGHSRTQIKCFIVDDFTSLY